jgi:hypothetical protein
VFLFSVTYKVAFSVGLFSVLLHVERPELTNALHLTAYILTVGNSSSWIYIVTYQGCSYVNYKTWIRIGTCIYSPLGYNQSISVAFSPQANYTD